MLSTILVWASLVLLMAALSVLTIGFTSSRRSNAQSDAPDGLDAVRAFRSSAQPEEKLTRSSHWAPLSSAYGHVVDATQQYAIEESSYVELKAEIVEAFARLELELDSRVSYPEVSNFERESILEANHG